MRRLLLLALVGMGLSKMYFGSFVPPNLKLNAPGFDILRGNSNARPPPAPSCSQSIASLIRSVIEFP